MKNVKRRLPPPVSLAMVAALVCLAFVDSPASAGQPSVVGGGALRLPWEKSKGKLVVVTIGINAYASDTMARFTLEFAVSDAKRLGNCAGKRGEAVFTGIVRRQVLDEEATRKGLDSLFEGLVDEVRPEDTVLVYVAAHGPTRNPPAGRDRSI